MLEKNTVKQYLEVKSNGEVIHAFIKINETEKNQVLFSKKDKLLSKESFNNNPSKEDIKGLNQFIEKNKKTLLQMFPVLKDSEELNLIKIIIPNEKTKIKNLKIRSKAEVLTSNVINYNFKEKWNSIIANEIKEEKYSFISIENRTINVNNMEYAWNEKTIPNPVDGTYTMNLSIGLVDKEWFDKVLKKSLSSMAKHYALSRSATLMKDIQLSSGNRINTKAIVLTDWGYDTSYVEYINGVNTQRNKIDVGFRNIVLETMKKLNISGKFQEKNIFKYITQFMRFGSINQSTREMNILRIQNDDGDIKEINLYNFVEIVRANLFATIDLIKEKTKFLISGMSEESAMWFHMGDINLIKDVSYAFKLVDIRLGTNQMLGGHNYADKITTLYNIDLYGAVVNAESDKNSMISKTRKSILAQQNSNEERIDDVARHEAMMAQLQNKGRETASLAKTKKQVLAIEKAKIKRGN